jgi:hypothetical protein
LQQPDELKAWTRALNVTREEVLAAGGGPPTSKKDQEFVETATECAREARHQAALLPAGPIRDALLEKDRGYETEVPEDKSDRWNLD